MKKTTPPTPRLSIILDNVRSVYNVGSLFRTADAVGVGMVWLAGFTPGPDTHPDRIAKTALGAQESVPWQRRVRVGDIVRRLRRQGVTVVALETAEHAVDFRKLKPRWPMVVIVGNEVKGVGSIMSHNIDSVVSIPMRGQKESLNVAVAAGVALYELTRNWQ